MNLIDPDGHSWWKKFWHKISGAVSWILGGVFLHSQVQQALSGGSWVPLIVQVAAFAANFLLPGVGTVGNIFMNVAIHAAVGAAEGAIIGGLSSVALGGSFGQGAGMGAISGAIGGAVNGFMTSQQFQNWQQTGKFASNANTYTLTAVVNNASASAPDVAQGAASIANSANNAGDAVCGPDYGGASGTWDDRGISAGNIITGSADGGVVSGSAGTYSLGNGYFSGSGLRSINFQSSGAISGIGNSDANVIGGSAGISGGGWLSNAGSASAFSGPFMTTTINTP